MGGGVGEKARELTDRERGTPSPRENAASVGNVSSKCIQRVKKRDIRNQMDKKKKNSPMISREIFIGRLSEVPGL